MGTSPRVHGRMALRGLIVTKLVEVFLPVNSDYELYVKEFICAGYDKESEILENARDLIILTFCSNCKSLESVHCSHKTSLWEGAEGERISRCALCKQVTQIGKRIDL